MSPLVRSTRPGPTTRFRPPPPQPGLLRRDRVTATIDTVVAASPLTVVSAPSGFGKTVAVAQWAAGLDRVAWLSLRGVDADPGRLTQGVVHALLVEAEKRGAAVDLAPGLTNPARAYEEICRVLDDGAARVHLVVDDAHRAGEDWRSGLLGMLAEQPPDGLRLVLVGTTLLEVTLSRQRLTQPESFLGVDLLRFTTAEVGALPQADRGGLGADAIVQETGGWPIAVRLMMIGGARPDGDAPSASSFLGEYVREHVLGALPAPIARFVLDATVCAELTPGLAAAVTGRADAAGLLESCVRLGLFLDRFEGPNGVVYRWHPTFARRCSEIAAQDDARFAACHRRAAEAMESIDPIAAIAHSLEAGDRGVARALLQRHWLGQVVGAGAAEVERTAMRLLRTDPDDAHVLLIRACACDVLGDHHVAGELLQRAEGLLAREGADDAAILSVARLFLADEGDDLIGAMTAVRAMLRDVDAVDLGDRAALNCLLGWAEIRRRGDPALPVEYFAAAAREAEGATDPDPEARALAHLAFGQAAAGRLVDARGTLQRARSRGDRGAPFTAYAGGSADAAAGFVAYWAGDAVDAGDAFAGVIAHGASDSSFAGLARMMIAFAAAESGDAAACRRAAIGVQDIPLDAGHGFPWAALRESAVAVLDEAIGSGDRALRIARRYVQCPDLPVVNVALAGVLRRAGEYPAALEMLRALRGFADVSYVKSAMLITAAVMRRHAGRPEEAHELCEAAIAVAAAEDVRLPFGPREAAVRRLLHEHVHFGTQFEDFIGRCLAMDAGGSLLDALSEREREVFQQLQTARTLPEIARELAVSINTVKTHQRAIYRKLGVSSRREAIRVTV
ncbi:LuxR C-terminal-related transcriptional regulator [Microbacterium sp. p3-SID336]|uniref:LuxR C-terminal-related transcriptional regulator n=1 Tax=Microbacterium sp. p3-SID336 TaxID=2916212 RepID=UPI0021A352A3|nr:LuxR C-terminal-related transcriptional regulator [Microbacterium sp. p3-SID336]MCT1479216.1 LuxR C-terminal-related transcriptional regulator [Microbacterium sp. p3-SID336]